MACSLLLARIVVGVSLSVNLGTALETYKISSFVKSSNTKTLLVNEDVKSTMTRSLLQCAGVCVRKPFCGRYWYLRNENRCYVGPRLLTENDFEGERNDKLYIVKGVYICRTDALNPLKRVVYNVDHACPRNHVTCSQEKTTQCPLSGRWDSQDRRCKRYSWRKPIAREVCIPLPCQTDLLQIHLVGRPTRKDEFSFRLIINGDILFLVSVRFNQHGHIRRVLFQTKLSSVWGEQVLCDGFPFRFRASFKMIVTLSQGVYTVSVDGGHVGSFKERLPGAKPQNYEIRGSVRMDSVTVLI